MEPTELLLPLGNLLTFQARLFSVHVGPLDIHGPLDKDLFDAVKRADRSAQPTHVVTLQVLVFGQGDAHWYTAMSDVRASLGIFATSRRISETSSERWDCRAGTRGSVAVRPASSTSIRFTVSRRV